MTSSTGGDLRSQGQGHVWNTGFLALTQVPFCYAAFTRRWNELGHVRALPVALHSLSPTHWMLTWRDLTGFPVETCSSCLSMLCWQIKIQWTPFVGSLIKIFSSQLQTISPSATWLGGSDSNTLTRGENDAGRRRYRTLYDLYLDTMLPNQGLILLRCQLC